MNAKNTKSTTTISIPAGSTRITIESFTDSQGNEKFIARSRKYGEMDKIKQFDTHLEAYHFANRSGGQMRRQHELRIRTEVKLETYAEAYAEAYAYVNDVILPEAIDKAYTHGADDETRRIWDRLEKGFDIKNNMRFSMRLVNERQARMES